MIKIVRNSATRVLAVGASGAIIAEEALAHDGRMILIEPRPEIVDRMRSRYVREGLDLRISIVGGEPVRMLHKLAGPFDFIVYDDPYSNLRGRFEALLAAGGTLVAHTGHVA